MPLFLPALKQYGHLKNVNMTVCNVGSRKHSGRDDYGSQGWGIFAPNLSIYGFDADADACNAANTDIHLRQVNWKESHFPLALGKAIETRTLYVTKNPMCSSLLMPNEPLLAKFNGVPELMNLDFSLDIETTTLDEFCQTESIDEIDFLQIDVQGAELDVLEGAKDVIKNVLAIQTEVSFSPFYTNQPLFADVDSYLRKKDFLFFDCGVCYYQRKFPITSVIRQGQMIWADAFYLRNVTNSDLKTFSLAPERVFKLACIADNLEFTDYCLELLIDLTLQFGSDPTYNFADIIVESLAKIPNFLNTDLFEDIVKVLQDFIHKT